MKYRIDRKRKPSNIELATNKIVSRELTSSSDQSGFLIRWLNEGSSDFDTSATTPVKQPGPNQPVIARHNRVKIARHPKSPFYPVRYYVVGEEQLGDTLQSVGELVELSETSRHAVAAIVLMQEVGIDPNIAKILASGGK